LGVQVAFSTLKTWSGFARAHVEQMRGTVLDSVAYCSKEDSNAFEWGTRPQVGGKTKELSVAVEAVERGDSLRAMAASGEHGLALVKNSNGLKTYRSLRSTPRDPRYPPCVFWIHGPTGCGKSSFSYEFSRNLFGLDGTWFSCTVDLKWFDGYDGQQCAIFEDFRSKGVAFNFVLRITDRYPLQVAFKGGFVNWAPQLIIFSTPHSVEDTFSERNFHRPEDIKQLLRRITRVYELPKDKEVLAQLLRESLQSPVDPLSVLKFAGLEQRELSPWGLEPKLPDEHLEEEGGSRMQDGDFECDGGLSPPQHGVD